MAAAPANKPNGQRKPLPPPIQTDPLTEQVCRFQMRPDYARNKARRSASL